MYARGEPSPVILSEAERERGRVEGPMRAAKSRDGGEVAREVRCAASIAKRAREAASRHAVQTRALARQLEDHVHGWMWQGFGDEWMRGIEIPFDLPEMRDVGRECGRWEDPLMLLMPTFVAGGEDAAGWAGRTHLVQRGRRGRRVRRGRPVGFFQDAAVESRYESDIMNARGSFDVKMSAEPPFDVEAGVSLSRVTFDKVFVGVLEATSKVYMLAARTNVENSAGYVAIERIVGTLSGRSGSFVVMHLGTMTRGESALSLTIVADSGTGELSGIAGTMKIDIVERKHFYEIEYTLG